MPTQAHVVIVGGGIAGASIAYHLAKFGQRDVVVLEQSELVSGTTSHAPGLVGQLRSDPSLTKMLMYSVSLYRTLRWNRQPGYFETGALRLASSKARFKEIQQQATFAKQMGLEAHLISAQEAKRLFPLLNSEGIEGALWVPHDGSATPTVLARAMIEAAAAEGVTFQPHVRVHAIDVAGGQVRAVETAQGRIETETLVIACGIWSPLVARLAGISVALVPTQHQYAQTRAIAELAGQTLPNLRDPDKLVYMRQTDDTLVLGGYERNPRSFQAEIPQRQNSTVHAFDADHFEQLWTAAAQRVPAIESAGLAHGTNGIESFTPDGEFLLGPSKFVRGLWIACGFCAHGISGAGGVGKVLAEWIVDGEPGLNVSHMHPDRFGPRANDLRFVERGALDVYRTYYDLREPKH